MFMFTMIWSVSWILSGTPTVIEAPINAWAVALVLALIVDVFFRRK